MSGDGESAAPNIAKIRYLTGVQFDLGPLGVYLQGQVSTGSVYGLGAGAHIGF